MTKEVMSKLKNFFLKENGLKCHFEPSTITIFFKRKKTLNVMVLSVKKLRQAYAKFMLYNNFNI